MKRAPRLRLAAGACLLVLVVLALLEYSDEQHLPAQDGEKPGPAAADMATTDSAGPSPDGGPGKTIATSAPEVPATRKAAEAARLSGTLVDQAGRPVAGALVTLHAGAPPEAPDGANEVQGSEVQRAVTGDGGGFTVISEFSGALVDTRPMVIWATARGYLAQALVLEPGVSDVVMRLTPGASIEVTVRAADGLPAGGVRVVQRLLGAVPGEWTGRAGLTEEIAPDALRLHFRRVAVTDAEGLVSLAAGRGQNSLLALDVLDRGRVSRREVARAGEHVDLELFSRVFVEGMVLAGGIPGLLSGTDPLPQVALGFMDELSVSVAGRLSVRADGSFGRCTLPVTAAGEAVAWLEAAGVAQRDVRLPAPEHNDVLRFELLAQAGLCLSVQVVDAEHEPLAGCRVEASWKVFERSCKESASTDSGGRANLSTLGEEYIYLTVSKPGHRTAQLRTSGHGSSREAEEAPDELVLEAGGSLAGQVVYRGQPVSDFHLFFFKGDPQSGTRRDVSDPEGRFLLPGVPLGEVSIYAATAAFPRSEIAQVMVAADSTEDIVLELSEPHRGVGRVIDEVSREPVPGVRIQLIAACATAGLTARGAYSYTDANGRFELDGLAPDTTSISLEHPEYSAVYNQVRADPTGVAELGTFSLSRLGLLSVNVMRIDGQPSSIPCEITGTNKYASKEVPSDGQLSYPGSSAGHAFLYIGDDDVWQRLKLTELSARKGSWEIPFDLRSRRVIEATLQGVSDPAGMECSASFMDASGLRVWDSAPWKPVQGGLRAEMPFLPEVPVVIEVMLEDGSLLGGVKVLPDGSVYQSVALTIPDEMWRMRVVDRAGEPVTSVKVEATLPNYETSWATILYTDENGIVELSPMPGGALRVCLLHGEYGDQLGELVTFQADGEIVDVVFDPSHELRVRLLDGEQPVASANVSVGHPDVPAQLMYRFTDDEGRLRWTRLGHRDIRLHITRHGLWPSDPVLNDTQGGREYTVQVRRLGGVELHVLTEDGVALPSVPIELVNEEFGESVADWIDEGEVSVEGGMVTDHRGKLTVSGIPNGRYTWTVGEASGSVRVPPEETGSATLHVP